MRCRLFSNALRTNVCKCLKLEAPLVRLHKCGSSLYMFCRPRRYDVYVVRGTKRLHVHPAHANTLGAVEPGEFFVSSRVGRSKNERRQYTEVAADGTRVAGRTQVKNAIIQAVDPRTRPR